MHKEKFRAIRIVTYQAFFFPYLSNNFFFFLIIDFCFSFSLSLSKHFLFSNQFSIKFFFLFSTPGISHCFYKFLYFIVQIVATFLSLSACLSFLPIFISSLSLSVYITSSPSPPHSIHFFLLLYLFLSHYFS